jgi:trimeric autotransporter adhesin
VALSGDGNTLSVGTPGDWSKSSNGENYNLENDVQEDFNSPSYGAVYIFTKTNNTWAQQRYLKAANPHINDRFGSLTALSFDGKTVAIAAIGESSLATGINGDQLDTASPASGAAYIFTQLGNDWLQKSYVKAPNSDANDHFARSIDLDSSGETFVIGAHRESSNAKGVNDNSGKGIDDNKANNTAPSSGAVYIY